LAARGDGEAAGRCVVATVFEVAQQPLSSDRVEPAGQVGDLPVKFIADPAAFPVPDAGITSPDQLVLGAAVAAYLGRYRGQTRLHTNSDLRIFLRWCDEQSLRPLAAVRTDIERYVRWLQDTCRRRCCAAAREDRHALYAAGRT
jgi:hypothetical protein